MIICRPAARIASGIAGAGSDRTRGARGRPPASRRGRAPRQAGADVPAPGQNGGTASGPIATSVVTWKPRRRASSTKTPPGRAQLHRNCAPSDPAACHEGGHDRGVPSGRCAPSKRTRWRSRSDRRAARWPPPAGRPSGPIAYARIRQMSSMTSRRTWGSNSAWNTWRGTTGTPVDLDRLELEEPEVGERFQLLVRARVPQDLQVVIAQLALERPGRGRDAARRGKGLQPPERREVHDPRAR